MPPARAGYPWRFKLRILAVGCSQGRDRGHSLSACTAGWCAARLGPHARCCSWYWPAAGLQARRACPAANTRFGFRVCRGRRCGFRQPAPSGSSRAPWPCYRPAGEPHCDVSPIARPDHDSSFYGPGRIIMTKKTQKILKKEIIKSRMHYKVKKQCRDHLHKMLSRCQQTFRNLKQRFSPGLQTKTFLIY